MSTDQDAAARRIMNQFGEKSRIPYLNIEEGDVGLIIAFPVVGLFIAGLTGIESLALPFVAGGFGFGIAIVSVSPDHLNAWTWTKDVYRYLKRPRITFNAPKDADSTTNETERNEGGLANYTPFKPDERTQDLTNIERAWPGADAIQRTDGSMEAFIEVDPGNMDFAMSDDWAQLQDAGEQFANKELNSKLKLHATTRSFPVEQITETIEDRLNDEDVTENPIFEELLEEYRENRPKEMRDRGIQQVRYYLGVEVTPLEVYDRYRDEGTPAEKLTQFPVIGFLFNPFVTRRKDLTDVEHRVQMFEKLDERVNDVRTEFIQQAAGWSARRLSTVELFVLNMDFWNGREHDHDKAERFVRQQPIIGHSHREDEFDA
ncbi:hypothetical protein [Halococcoides cellulosivorans]|uniref:Uncharacterized protein n=1 Tax=Halococcoides cellulosivorans TaxID=1679096 RepID=A0A2R4X405_9EURY|nr:hypothetical protein [Halococcoides cellulosivorans]AWB28433.1 hypothetical protein HARCEL1_12345 [Halococcoides cellulosivorans]